MMHHAADIIRIRDLSKNYPDVARDWVQVLRGLSLGVAEGELVAILGPSGSGKSTLLQLVGGLDSPTAGTIEIEGISVGELSERERTALRHRHIGFIFQTFYMIPSMTLIENVALTSIVSGGRAAAWRPRALELLTTLGLADQAERYPHQLSGGQRQRIAVARAMFGAPAVILADEPTGNLDTQNSHIVLRLIRQAIDQSERTCGLLVTHDLEAAGYADRVVSLRDGMIVDELDLREVTGLRQEDGVGNVERIRTWLAATAL